MNRADEAGEVSRPRHRGGRYLDGSRDVVLREAALALLAEVGYDRLTMDAVAARCSVMRPRLPGWPGQKRQARLTWPGTHHGPRGPTWCRARTLA